MSWDKSWDKILWPVLGIVLGGLSGYFTSRIGIEHRLTVVEKKLESNDGPLREMEQHRKKVQELRDEIVRIAAKVEEYSTLPNELQSTQEEAQKVREVLVAEKNDPRFKLLAQLEEMDAQVLADVFASLAPRVENLETITAALKVDEEGNLTVSTNLELGGPEPCLILNSGKTRKTISLLKLGVGSDDYLVLADALLVRSAAKDRFVRIQTIEREPGKGGRGEIITLNGKLQGNESIETHGNNFIPSSLW